jgi:hypothetical protein
MSAGSLSLDGRVERNEALYCSEGKKWGIRGKSESRKKKRVTRNEWRRKRRGRKRKWLPDEEEVRGGERMQGNFDEQCILSGGGIARKGVERGGAEGKGIIMVSEC